MWNTKQPRQFLKVSNLEEKTVLPLRIGTFSCLRCDMKELANDLGQRLEHFVCSYCRKDSLEFGRDTGEVSEAESLNELNNSGVASI